jgi:hypothetical protein
MKLPLILTAAIIVIGVGWLLLSVMGEGALRRHITISGLYSICKPDGYEVVCFLDADGKDGGMFCLPLSQVGGKCK